MLTVMGIACDGAFFIRMNSLLVLLEAVLTQQELGKKRKLICFKDNSEKDLRDLHWAALVELWEENVCSRGCGNGPFLQRVS